MAKKLILKSISNSLSKISPNFGEKKKMFSILTYHGTPSKKASIVESLFSHLKKKKKKNSLLYYT
jgi:nickel-dependent lactate racemase